MRRLIIAAVSLTIVAAFLPSAHAKTYESFGPFPIRNQNPVYLQNLGLAAKRAEVLPQGTLETRVDASYSNLLERASTPALDLNFDMEYLRLDLNASYGLTPDLEIGVDIPFVHFGGGFLDGFVRTFHEAFGFPNGFRGSVPDNRFSYKLAVGGTNVFNYPPAGFELGDVILHVKQQLAGEDKDWPDLSWFAEIKLPSGKRSRGVGSGAPDFGFGAALTASYRRLHGHFNAAYYVLGGNSMLDKYKYMFNQMFSYMVAGEITILPTWSALVQLDGSTPLFTGIRDDQWNGVPLNLTLGFKGEERDMVGKNDFIWQVGFSEDVTAKGPSVDFTVFVSIGFRFDLFGRKRPQGDWLARQDEAAQTD
jgi:hypothetical protein